MQQLDTIQTDDDYLIPATELAEAYLKDHNLSFDFASNKPIFIKYYVNKIWVERKAACPHFVEILEAYNNRRR